MVSTNVYFCILDVIITAIGVSFTGFEGRMYNSPTDVNVFDTVIHTTMDKCIGLVFISMGYFGGVVHIAWTLANSKDSAAIRGFVFVADVTVLIAVGVLFAVALSECLGALCLVAGFVAILVIAQVTAITRDHSDERMAEFNTARQPRRLAESATSLPESVGTEASCHHHIVELNDTTRDDTHVKTDESACVICLENTPCVALNCGHTVLCSKCWAQYDTVGQNTCPVCKMVVTHVLHLWN